jgi:hypothetical protein
VASLAGDVLDAGLGSVGDVLAKALFVLSVAALTVAAILGLAGVLRPQLRLGIATEELATFGSHPRISAPPIEIHGMMINTLVEALRHERAVNDRKARLTRLTGVALLVGYSGVAAFAVAVAFAS